MLVRYYGHVGLHTGYGDAANEFCMALLQAGDDIELEISTDGQDLHRSYAPLVERVVPEPDLTPNPDIIIIHTLPMDCLTMAKRAVHNISTPCRKFAYTTWEGASAIPSDMAWALSAFDQVWVPSETTATAMRQGLAGHAEVAVVPHAFDRMAPVVSAYYDKNQTYRFYYIGAWTVRKNVEGVVRAYLRAFDRLDNVELVLHCYGATTAQCLLAMLGATGMPLDQLPRVVITTDRKSPEDVAQMHHDNDCFVTASRGESWNLGAFEAMLAGRHVIAPEGLGSDDFLRETSADFCQSRLSPAAGEVKMMDVGPDGRGMARYFGAHGLTVRADWREPDINHLAILMRRAWAQRKHTISLSYDPVERFGRAAVGRRIRALLEGVKK